MKNTQKFESSAWELNELFSGLKDPEIKRTQKELSSLAASVAAYRGKLDDKMDIKTFHEVIELLRQIAEKSNILGSYPFLLFCENTQNAEALAFIGQVESFVAEINNQTLFVSLWWKSLSDEQARSFLEQTADYRYFLEALRKTKPYTLPETVEKVINLKNVTGSNALLTLYEAITNRYQFEMIADRKKEKLTYDSLMKYVRDENPNLRKRAYQALYRVHENDGVIIGQIYQNIVRDWHNEHIRTRNYPSPIAVRNTVNDIPDQVVEVLLNTCQKNKNVFQRYFQLKKKALKLKTLRRYDIYAPLSKSGRKYTFSEAFDLMQQSFTAFDPSFAEMAMKVFREKHVHSTVQHGKRSGAFCATITPELTPWVLLNFQGEFSDVSTMAHELGHAIHSLSSAHHHIFHQDVCLPLAETASTFGEMLLTDYVLKQENDPSVKVEILMQQMDHNYASIQRQAYFALFEKTAHDLIPNGTDVDGLNAAYLENLKDQFGKSVSVSDEFKWEWSVIPHIFATPFYVYAYAFGQLLVLSLYQRYKAEGSSFIPSYKKILAAGGSEAPEKVLAAADINFYDEAFWQGGFSVLEENVSEIERYL